MTPGPGSRRRGQQPRHRLRPRLRSLGRLRVALAATAVLGLVTVGGAVAYRDAVPGGRAMPPPRETTELTAGPPMATRPPDAPPEPSAKATPRVPEEGSQEFIVAAGGSGRAGRGIDLIGYRIEVEKDLPFDSDDFAKDVERTLSDPRGWTRTGRHSFQRNERGPVRIVLATPTTTDKLCAPLQTRREVSCRNGDVVAINAVRWAEGAASYKSVERYHTYVINHEVGHRLGRAHALCPLPGAKAPVMLQQTLGLDGCRANPWP